MNYTLAHLKIAHYVGGQNVPFEETVETISLLERNGIIDSEGNWSVGLGQERRKHKIQKPVKTTGKAGKRRGDLSLMITGFLSTKGKTGAHLKEIAQSIKAPPGSVTTWFYTTGKKYRKTGEIKKVGPATFAYVKA